MRQFENPIILILVVASVLAFFLGDIVDSAIILAIVLLSGLLGFWRERGAAGAVQALLALVRTEAEVRRDGRLFTGTHVVTGTANALVVRTPLGEPRTRTS